MGRVYKRPDTDSWYVDFVNADGQRKRLSVPEASSKRQAEKSWSVSLLIPKE